MALFRNFAVEAVYGIHAATVHVALQSRHFSRCLPFWLVCGRVSCLPPVTSHIPFGPVSPFVRLRPAPRGFVLCIQQRLMPSDAGMITSPVMRDMHGPEVENRSFIACQQAS